MRKTIIESYGVDQDKRYNRLITEAWDTAQREVWRLRSTRGNSLSRFGHL